MIRTLLDVADWTLPAATITAFDIRNERRRKRDSRQKENLSRPPEIRHNRTEREPS